MIGAARANRYRRALAARARREPVRAIYAAGLIGMGPFAVRALQYYRRNPNG